MIKERKPNRLKGYDYSSDNLYFITSCVQNRICCFGKIVVVMGRDPSQQMILNEWGAIAENQWYWLSEQYPYVLLHAFIVMPNHIHGIIEINRNNVGTGRVVGTGRDLSLRHQRDLSLRHQRDPSL
jgi:REP element-mobilizing transposase RayT